MSRSLTLATLVTATFAFAACDGDAGKTPGQTRVVDGTEDPFAEYGGERDERENARVGDPEEGNMHGYASNLELLDDGQPPSAYAQTDLDENADEEEGVQYEAQGPDTAKGITAADLLQTARAEVKDKKGKVLGTATFEAVPVGVMITFEGQNLPPGEHGFHIHQTGKCDKPDFKSAGDHFSPMPHDHGFGDGNGFHLGDMPNIAVGKDGKVKMSYVLPGVMLAPGLQTSLFDDDESALVVHDKADDYKTDPSGNAGDRIGCGVIEKQS